MTTNDLFEALWHRVGCTYMSDMTRSPYREQAIREAKEMELSAYGQRQIDDLCQYLSIDRAMLEASVL